MKYKAKPTYKELKNSENFVSLGAADKHIWLMEGMAINFNRKVPDKLKKHIEEVKSASKSKGEK